VVQEARTPASAGVAAALYSNSKPRFCTAGEGEVSAVSTCSEVVNWRISVNVTAERRRRSRVVMDEGSV